MKNPQKYILFFQRSILIISRVKCDMLQQRCAGASVSLYFARNTAPIFSPLVSWIPFQSNL